MHLRQGYGARRQEQGQKQRQWQRHTLAEASLCEAGAVFKFDNTRPSRHQQPESRIHLTTLCCPACLSGVLIRDTYNEKSVRRKIDAEVGKKFSFLERFKMGGIGSQRMRIISSSEEIDDLLQADAKRNLCNIEMRTGGLIVRFQSKMHTYAWTIPWHSLSLFRNGEVLSVYGSGNHIKVVTEYNESLDRRFVLKVMQYKALWSEDHPTLH